MAFKKHNYCLTLLFTDSSSGDECRNEIYASFKTRRANMFYRPASQGSDGFVNCKRLLNRKENKKMCKEKRTERDVKKGA